MLIRWKNAPNPGQKRLWDEGRLRTFVDGVCNLPEADGKRLLELPCFEFVGEPTQKKVADDVPTSTAPVAPKPTDAGKTDRTDQTDQPDLQKPGEGDTGGSEDKKPDAGEGENGKQDDGKGKPDDEKPPGSGRGRGRPRRPDNVSIPQA